jgi:hypothetical protein
MADLACRVVVLQKGEGEEEEVDEVGYVVGRYIQYCCRA